jgi:hypothetical protein
MEGYRGTARPDPYDPSIRVRPCDACGTAFVARDAETVHTCDHCRHEQSVPDARPVFVPTSPAGDEAERLAHLSTQLDHQWWIPKSVVRFGANVLEEEVDEARAVWAELRQKLEANPDDREGAVAFLCVTFALHGGMPAATREERFARRAIAEASAEAQSDAHLRQKTLYNLGIGAVRSGAHAHARVWLERFDPRSRSLDADSSYRMVAAALATALGDPPRVLELLGRTASELPIHQSSRSLAAVLRAGALEKLGNLEAAVDGLYDEVRRRHSALANITELVGSFTREWGLCERSLPLVMERDRHRLIDNVPARRGPALRYGFFASLAFLAVVLELEGWRAIVAILGGIFATGMAWFRLRQDTERRRQIVRDCVHVSGRVLAMRPLGPGNSCELDVVVERADLPDARVTTQQSLAPRIQKLQLEGCSFEALWNPAHPTLFPRITINVSGDA